MFNLDIAIFVGFLILNLIFGLLSSKGIRTIKEYAIGDRNFSTTTIAATLVATWIGGEDFFAHLTEAYNNGLYFIWAGALGYLVSFLSIGYIFAPRLGEFLGKLSIAEAMGDLYGKHVRIITSIAGFIGASGVIAVQLNVAGLLFEYSFGVPGMYGVIIGGIIITLYSTLGGIKSVTFTDLVQLFTFGTIIPTIALFIVSTLDSADAVIDTITAHKLFDYQQVFDFTNSQSLYYLLLFFFIAIPAFNPAIFQRISMSKNTAQIRRSFIIAGFTCFFLILMIYWIAILILSSHPEIIPNEVGKHIIFNYSYIGLKGLTLAGVMAMVMSSADSYVNSTSILLVHDFCKPLGINIVKNELIFSRLASLAIGLFSILLAMRSGSILQLMITANILYMPIVTVPFIMAVLGFRSSSKSALIGMGAGFAAVIIWEAFFKTGNIDGLIPGMVANLVFLIGSHYLLRQPGGWVGIKDKSLLLEDRRRRKETLAKLVNSIINFNFIKLCKKNSPSQEGMYIYFGIFCIISMYCVVHTLPKEIQILYPTLIRVIYLSVLFAATTLISYPLWLSHWRKKTIIGVLWNIVVFYVLICVSFLFVIISNFAEVQLMTFMVNLILIAILVRWQWMLVMLFFGTMVTTLFLKFYLMTDIIILEHISSSHFKIVYLLLLVSSILIIFLKPKQEYQELTEQKNEHLHDRLIIQDEELQKAVAVKAEFLRNVAHEYHASLTGVLNSAEILRDVYDRLTDEHKRSAIDNIYQSAISLKSLDDNVVTLARICEPDYKLDIKATDFSSLVYERVENCRKYYEDNKDDREFVFNIQEGVIANIDTSHMNFALDNLIMNAIKFCPKGKIIITLSKTLTGVEFTIEDEGIGIPKTEIYDIFDSFKVSSKTWTPAGGRGIGLALCKGIIRKHEGTIEAESDGIKGALFKVILPA